MVASHEDMTFVENGEICEKLAEDKPYIRHVCNCLQPLFCIGVDCRKGYFVFIRPKNR